MYKEQKKLKKRENDTNYYVYAIKTCFSCKTGNFSALCQKKGSIL